MRRSRRSRPPRQKIEEAVKQQQDLLAEFEKIADELNRVLANLEGSTLVKRLKAASRHQYKIGGRISDQVSAVFGVEAYQVAVGSGEGPGRAVRAGRQGQQGRLDASWTTCTRTSSGGGSSGSRRCSTRCGSSTSWAACGSSATT